LPKINDFEVILLMEIYEKIIETLKKEYAAGATYQELADKYQSSYTHIHNLLSGKRSISGISLDFFFRLFPRAAVNLEGDSVNIDAPRNSGNVVGVNNGSVIGGSMEPAIDKILASEDLSDSEKIKVLKVLKK
jgi:hypothetical protein